MLPDTHDWLISPDFGVLLIGLIEENAHDAVVEFGSGTSTVLLAKALQRVAAAAARAPAPLVSFEHLEKYLEKTRRRLAAAALAEAAEVVSAPLVPWKSPDGKEFRFYDCRDALRRLQGRTPASGARILVLVDGPPTATGPLACYPALPAMLDVFGISTQYQFLIDDVIRDDEKKVATAWVELLRQKKIPLETTDYKKLEKQALLISVN